MAIHIMKVYEIVFEEDDYQSLLASDDEDLDCKLMSMDGETRTSKWPSILHAEIDNRSALKPDIFSLNSGNMLLNSKAFTVLEKYFTEFEELLPVCWENESGTVINPLGDFDCLDYDKTIWCKDESSGVNLWIENYAFDLDKVPNNIIFRATDDYFSLFCVDKEDGSENFKSLVENNGLLGLSFEPV